MGIAQERRQAIKETAEKILSIIGDAPSVARMEQAKPHLMALAARKDLFPAQDFPAPQGETTDRTYLIYDNADGAALYAIAAIPGMTYRPHDHGGSWAMIAAVQGQEKHYLYQVDPAAPATPVLKDTLTCEPGTAVSLLPDGIHAIEGVGTEPLLHLHFYGTRFEDQGDRTEYDLAGGRTDVFRIEAFGFIEDKR